MFHHSRGQVFLGLFRDAADGVPGSDEGHGSGVRNPHGQRSHHIKELAGLDTFCSISLFCKKKSTAPG